MGEALAKEIRCDKNRVSFKENEKVVEGLFQPTSNFYYPSTKHSYPFI